MLWPEQDLLLALSKHHMVSRYHFFQRCNTYLGLHHKLQSIWGLPLPPANISFPFFVPHVISSKILVSQQAGFAHLKQPKPQTWQLFTPKQGHNLLTCLFSSYIPPKHPQNLNLASQGQSTHSPLGVRSQQNSAPVQVWFTETHKCNKYTENWQSYQNWKSTWLSSAPSKNLQRTSNVACDQKHLLT